MKHWLVAVRARLYERLVALNLAVARRIGIQGHTLSGHAYRLHIHGGLLGRWWMNRIDGVCLFFGSQRDHCEKAYLNGLKRITKEQQ